MKVVAVNPQDIKEMLDYGLCIRTIDAKETIVHIGEQIYLYRTSRTIATKPILIDVFCDEITGFNIQHTAEGTSVMIETKKGHSIDSTKSFQYIAMSADSAQKLVDSYMDLEYHNYKNDGWHFVKETHLDGTEEIHSEWIPKEDI